MSLDKFFQEKVMSLDKFLGEAQKIITASQQGDLFGNKDALIKKSKEICVDYLKGRGYSIGPPVGYPAKITKLHELVSMFYGFVRNIYPKQLWSYSNDKQDRAIAKAFIEGRMKDDMLDYDTALKQCALIIQIVFRRPDIFRFETAPTFGVLGQASMGWVTERAVKLINEQIVKDNKIADERAAEKMTKKIEENSPNVGYSLEELETIRKKLEG